MIKDPDSDASDVSDDENEETDVVCIYMCILLCIFPYLYIRYLWRFTLFKGIVSTLNDTYFCVYLKIEEGGKRSKKRKSNQDGMGVAEWNESNLSKILSAMLYLGTVILKFCLSGWFIFYIWKIVFGFCYVVLSK
jgi:hypothetical protein